MIILFFMFALFASVFTVGKITLQYVDPFFLTGIRMLLAAGILFIFQLVRDPKKISFQKKHFPLILFLSVFNVFITNGLEFWGLQYMETAKTCMIYNLSPFAAILFSYFFLREKMVWKKWVGLLIGLIGFLPIFLNASHTNLLLSSLPEFAVSISAVTAVAGWIAMKKLIRDFAYPFLIANAFSFLFGGLFSLGASLIFEDWHPLPLTSWPLFIAGVVYIALVHNVICYNLYGYSLQKFSVPFITFAGFSSPLFTAIYGWIFLNEQPGLSFFVSFVLVFLGIFIYFRAETDVKAKEEVPERI